MLTPLIYWGTLLFYLLAMLGGNLVWKNSHKGILPFRKAVQLGFVSFLIANLIFFAFYYWIFNSDPELVEIQLKMMQEFAESYPVGSEARTQLESVEITSSDITFGHCVNKYLRGALGGFLIAVLIALLVKQEK